MGKDDLVFCDTVPDSFSTDSCQTVWSANGLTSAGNLEASPPPSASSSSLIPFSTQVVTSTSTTFGTASTGRPTVAVVADVGHSVSVCGSDTDETPMGILQESDDDSDDDSEFGDDSDSEFGDDSDDIDDIDDIVAGVISRFGKRQSSDDVVSFESVSAFMSNGSVDVIANGQGMDGETLKLSQMCLFTLNWPVEMYVRHYRQGWYGVYILKLFVSVSITRNERTSLLSSSRFGSSECLSLQYVGLL